jgi:nicotinamide-nucleotide amidase
VSTAELTSFLSDRLRELGWSLAVAESMTCGRLACELGAAENASEWFLGGVIAYSEEVKFDVLQVSRGPVVTVRAAQQMAEGVTKLTGADVGISVTGVGGPGPHEGQPAGTVFIGVCSPSGEEVSEHQFSGPPDEVIEQATLQALLMVESTLPSMKG